MKDTLTSTRKNISKQIAQVKERLEGNIRQEIIQTVSEKAVKNELRLRRLERGANEMTQQPEQQEEQTPQSTLQRARSNQFDRVCVASKKIFTQRNEQYGDTITVTGVLGAAVELIGTSARLRPLVLKDPEHGKNNRDALIDVLKDIHNYANIGLIMLAADNWDGE